MLEKIEKINQVLLNTKETDPIELINSIMKEEYIPMHGPIHHYLDGAILLTCIHHIKMDFDLKDDLDKLAERAVKMPGAMCGHWGVCGSAASIGAALSVYHHSGPLSTDEYYKDHMEYTSMVINKQSKLGGARCCKRNAYIALTTAMEFVKDKYQIELSSSSITCEFSPRNQQCLKERCPFHQK